MWIKNWFSCMKKWSPVCLLLEQSTFRSVQTPCPGNLGGNGEGAVPWNSSSGRRERKGWSLPPGRWERSDGGEVASLRSDQSAQLQLGEDVLLHPLYWGRLILNLISSFSSFTGRIWVWMKHESYPMEEVRNTVIDAFSM